MAGVTPLYKPRTPSWVTTTRNEPIILPYGFCCAALRPRPSSVTCILVLISSRGYSATVETSPPSVPATRCCCGVGGGGGRDGGVGGCSGSSIGQFQNRTSATAAAARAPRCCSSMRRSKCRRACVPSLLSSMLPLPSRTAKASPSRRCLSSACQNSKGIYDHFLEL